jgi:hypothetical protein
MGSIRAVSDKEGAQQRQSAIDFRRNTDAAFVSGFLSCNLRASPAQPGLEHLGLAICPNTM